MDCPIAQIDTCFQVALACNSHLGVLLAESDSDYASGVNDAVSDLSTTFIGPGTTRVPIIATEELHLPTELYRLIGCDPLQHAAKSAKLTDKQSKKPIIVVIHFVDALSMQNQVYLGEILANPHTTAEGMSLMFVCSFAETSQRMLSHQLLDGLLLCPKYSKRQHSTEDTIKASTTPMPKYLMTYLRDILAFIRHDTTFFGSNLAPFVSKTIEQILIASGCPWSLATFREYLPYILAHRLEVALQPEAQLDAKVALILSSMSHVALPP